MNSTSSAGQTELPWWTPDGKSDAVQRRHQLSSSRTQGTSLSLLLAESLSTVHSFFQLSCRDLKGEKTCVLYLGIQEALVSTKAFPTHIKLTPSSLLFLATLLHIRQGFASKRPLLEERGHCPLVDLLTPHAHDACIHLSCCSLATQVVQQLKTGMLQPSQLGLGGHQTLLQHCTALSRAAAGQQLQDTRPLTGTVQQPPAALPQGLEMMTDEDL
ncbi:hypothetical protein INR49_002042 [Caranx melampygus]|nr:hypothetical protein INR49_002042 [Caranx melampygus]